MMGAPHAGVPGATLNSNHLHDSFLVGLVFARIALLGVRLLEESSELDILIHLHEGVDVARGIRLEAISLVLRPLTVLVSDLTIAFFGLEGDLNLTELVSLAMVALRNFLVRFEVSNRDVDILASDLLANPSIKLISLAVLVRDSVHDAADGSQDVS